MLLTPPDDYGYYDVQVHSLDIVDESLVSITLASISGATYEVPHQITWQEYRGEAPQEVQDTGDQFDADRIWTGRPSTAKRVSGTAAAGTLLMHGDYLTELIEQHGAPRDLVGSIKWPSSAPDTFRYAKARS